jgi:acyl-CoA thioesterase FadM
MSDVKPFEFVVPFDEADGEGIVFFGNYFRLAHRTLEWFLPQVGISWESWFRHPEYGVPLRHAEAEYFRPIRPGDRIQVATEIVKVGESSVEFVFEFRGDGTNAASARVRTVHVFVLRRPFGEKAAVPSELREKLTALAN